MLTGQYAQLKVTFEKPWSQRIARMQKKGMYEIIALDLIYLFYKAVLSGAFANSWGVCRDPIWGTGNRFIVHIAEYELSKMSRDTLPGNETAVGADLSCAPPIYRPTRTSPCILVILLIVIIGPGSHPRI
ncbi:MAG: hypothetical protein ACJ8DI_08750 [Ktedonobacteraceae bacterium]